MQICKLQTRYFLLLESVQVNLNAEGIQFDDPNYCSRARTNHDIPAHTTVPAAAASMLLMGYL